MREQSDTDSPSKPVEPSVLEASSNVETAIVYCEGQFGALDGKTANGLVRHSEKYKIVSVIDSGNASLDSGVVLDGLPNNIPICNDLADAISKTGTLPDYFIFGLAPASGMLSKHERRIIFEAIELGMNIVNGLHEFLNDDPEFAAASAANNVIILDIRKPRKTSESSAGGSLRSPVLGSQFWEPTARLVNAQLRRY